MLLQSTGAQRKRWEVTHTNVLLTHQLRLGLYKSVSLKDGNYKKIKLLYFRDVKCYYSSPITYIVAGRALSYLQEILFPSLKALLA